MNEDKAKGIIAYVAVEGALYSFDRLYGYLIPPELRGEVGVGARVIVPFGRGARKINGVVMEVALEQEYDVVTTKKIYAVSEGEPRLNEETLALICYLKETTFCTYYDAVKCASPTLALSKSGGGEKKRGSKTRGVVRLPDNFDDSIIDGATPKQRAVVAVLENGAASIKELCYLCGVTAAVVTNLIKKGVIEEVAVQEEPETVAAQTADPNDIELNGVQQKAYDGIMPLLLSDQPKCALLRGVTGSGKTSVFIKLIGEALNRGKTAIVLVPEISLTPQTIAIFTGYFGGKAAVIHSGLPISRRAAEYARIRSGEATIVIGTRSAIFAPLKNIGIIVIDEEGEHTYKSERTPRYHARDVAKQRCFRHNALLLLSSATPSMDSYYRAKTGRYSLFEMEKRYSGNALPDVYIVDMKIETALGNRSLFSEAFARALKVNLEKGEQSLILLNRRGYNTYVCCVACGETAACPNCALPLTYHKAADSLACHYCGYSRKVDEVCPKCGSRSVRKTGTGTQRVEDELSGLLPDARILRMDADTIFNKDTYEREFTSFGDGEYDVMVGTQMIAKGLDFPNVTLVGALLIDKSLYAGDYLGYERTFTLITQMVGRAGRGGKKGRAFLQTYTPDHYVLQLAARQDYAGFYREEAAIRETLLFPPFCDLCIAEFSSADEKTAVKAAEVFAELFAELSKPASLPVRVLGPVRSGAGSINGKFRLRLIIKCRNNKAFRAVMEKALVAAHSDKRFAFAGISAWFE